MSVQTIGRLRCAPRNTESCESGSPASGAFAPCRPRPLRDLPEVASLVVADPVPGRAREVADRLHVHLAVARRRGCSSRASTRWSWRPPRTRQRTSSSAPVDHGPAVFCEKPGRRRPGRHGPRSSSGCRVPTCRCRSASSAPVRRRLRRGAGGRGRRPGWAGLHTIRAGPLRPAPPPAAYVATPPAGCMRDCSVHDFDAIRWVTGVEVVEVVTAGGKPGRGLFFLPGVPATWTTAAVAADPRRRQPRPGERVAVQTARATTCAGTARLAGQPVRGAGRRLRAGLG